MNKRLKQPQLPITKEERRMLRAVKICLRELAEFNRVELNQTTGISKSRCEQLIALSQFQRLGSIGLDMAQKLWQLEYRSISNLAKANPTKMYQDYSKLIGSHVDPCVEDAFRCAVAQAKYPELPEHLKQWWEWTDQRGQTDVNWKE